MSMNVIGKGLCAHGRKVAVVGVCLDVRTKTNEEGEGGCSGKQ